MSTQEMSVWVRRTAGALICCVTMASCAKDSGDQDMVQRTVKASAGETVITDSRTAITVDAGTRLAVLNEMRTMLKAVQGIVGGVANQDTGAVRASALMAGMGAASEAEPEVQRLLGPEFVGLGMRTHMAFDSLAGEVGRTSGRDATLRRLGTIMGNCVGCHEQWRLVVQP